MLLGRVSEYTIIHKRNISRRWANTIFVEKRSEKQPEKQSKPASQHTITRHNEDENETKQKRKKKQGNQLKCQKVLQGNRK